MFPIGQLLLWLLFHVNIRVAKLMNVGETTFMLSLISADRINEAG